MTDRGDTGRTRRTRAATVRAGTRSLVSAGGRVARDAGNWSDPYHGPMRYAALLRGVNVGGRTMAMADLASCFTALGFEAVSTVLQSGNVVFEGPADPVAVAARVEAGLKASFSFPVRCQIVESPRLSRVVAAYPFDDVASMHRYVVFFEGGLESQVAAALELDPRTERVALGEAVLYWQVQKGATTSSAVAAQLTRSRFKEFHTNRNLRTLEKMLG